MPLICFYPMSKSRGEKRNWYALPFEERKKLMGGHGTTGRQVRRPRPAADHQLAPASTTGNGASPFSPAT